MSDDAATSNVQIPEEIRAKYPDLIELVLRSESMNDEERQYWVNILPIMTPEQVENLQEILVTEKSQLEEIDKKYASKIQAASAKADVEEMEEEREKRRAEREEKQQVAEQEEEQEEEDLLKQIEGL